MSKYLFLSILFFGLVPVSVFALFERERAAVCAQKDEWGQATELLQSLIVSNYDNPELLYDAGVASLKTGSSVQAGAYFEQAALHAQASSELKERAYFNAGNASVASNELEKAITQYQHALKINATNQYAQHNMERVQQMLAEQKEKQKNKDQDDKKKSDTKEQQQDKDTAQNKESEGSSEDDQKKEDSADQKKDGNTNDDSNREGNNKGQSQKGGDQNNDSGADQSEGNKSPQDKKTEPDKGDGKNDQNRDQNDAQGKGDKDSENKLENGRDSGKQSDEQGEHNDQSHSGIDNNNQDTQELEKSQGAATSSNCNQPEFKPEDQWIAQLLDERDESDGKYTKQLTKSTIDKNLAGKHGQNCW